MTYRNPGNDRIFFLLAILAEESDPCTRNLLQKVRLFFLRVTIQKGCTGSSFPRQISIFFSQTIFLG